MSRHTNDEHAEHQPLLPSHTAEAKPPSRKTIRTRLKNLLLPTIHVTHPRYRFLPLIGSLIILLGDGEYYFKEVGYWRALESLYCLEYYQSANPDLARLGRHIPEAMCKLDPIGRNVATALGIAALVRFVSCFVGTLPLGYAADRVGRRFVLVMHKVGTTVYTGMILVMYYGYPRVPIWVSFLGGTGGLIGANIDLNLSVMLAAYTDALTSKSQRETCYYATSAMQFVAQIIWPLAAGAAINMDGQGGTAIVSLWISAFMSVAGLLISAFVWPETLQRDEAISINAESEGETSPAKSSLLSSARSKFKSSWNNFQNSVRLLGMPALSLLILSGFLVAAAVKVVCWLGVVQYPVVRFQWTYAQSTVLLTVQAFVWILLFFAILPSLRKSGSRIGLTHKSTSLWIMLLSVAFLEAGGILLGLAASPAVFIAATCIFTLGAALPDIIKAFVANLVDKSHLGIVLGVFSLSTVGGKVFAAAFGPVMLNIGIASNNEYLKGLVFLFAAVLGFVAALALGIIAIRAGVEKQASVASAERGNDQEPVP